MTQPLQRSKTGLIVFLSDLWFRKAQQAGWLCVSRGKAAASSPGESRPPPAPPVEAWGPPGAGAGKEEQIEATPQAGRPWWWLGVGPVPSLAPHLSTQGLYLSFPTEMNRKPVTAVSFKGTIEGACLQAWEPWYSSWLTASVVSGRLGQNNQGQQ